MIRAIAKRNFLLRRELGVDIVAKRGEAIMVSSEELRKFKADLIPLKK
jgi:hypothetical protein